MQRLTVLPIQTLQLELALPNIDLSRYAGDGTHFLLEKDCQQFLFSEPHEILSIQDGALQVETKDGVVHRLPGNPVVALRERLEAYRPAPSSQSPFASGAVGYLGYDCVQYLENIRLSEIPAAEDEACFLVYQQAIVSDGKSVKVICNGFGEAPDASAFERVEALLRAPLPPPAELSGRAEAVDPFPSDENFTSAARTVKQHIRQGDVFQCVLSQRQNFALTETPESVYQRLRALSPTPFRYFFRSARQILLGASPERLVRVQGKEIDTCPIAGTRPRGETPQEDARRAQQLLRSPKERAEHLMLVDLSRNDLGRVCEPGSVRVGTFRKLQRFSHVMHLVSTVHGKLASDQTALSALFAAFPAGTLTGAPKIRAMQLIAELEPQRRGAYGGAVVLYDFGGDLDSCITIRSLVAHAGKASVQAGAGLVADSQVNRELAEIQHKARAVKRALRAEAV